MTVNALAPDYAAKLCKLVDYPAEGRQVAYIYGNVDLQLPTSSTAREGVRILAFPWNIINRERPRLRKAANTAAAPCAIDTLDGIPAFSSLELSRPYVLHVLTHARVHYQLAPSRFPDRGTRSPRCTGKVARYRRKVEEGQQKGRLVRAKVAARRGGRNP